MVGDHAPDDGHEVLGGAAWPTRGVRRLESRQPVVGVLDLHHGGVASRGGVDPGLSHEGFGVRARELIIKAQVDGVGVVAWVRQQLFQISAAASGAERRRLVGSARERVAGGRVERWDKSEEHR